MECHSKEKKIMAKLLKDYSKEINPGFNFENGNIEKSLAYWNLYKDAVQSTPVNGTGGTSLYLTKALDITTPLIGKGSLLLSKSANNAEGEGLSIDFSIDRGQIFNAIQMSFIYETSANFVDGDIGLYVYDIDNSILLNVSETNLLGTLSNPDKFMISFLPTSSLNYRFILHVASTNVLAWTCELDNIEIGNTEKYSVSAVSGFDHSYVPTITATTTAPTKGTTSVDIMRWGRVGTMMKMMYTYVQTVAGAVGSGAYLIAMPDALSIATSLLMINNTVTATNIGYGTRVGSGHIQSTIVSNTNYSMPVSVYVYDSTHLVIIQHNSSGYGYPWGSGSLPLSGYPLYVSLNIEVPIAQWSTNVNLISDTQEFVSNSQATINTNDTTSFAYGSEGAAILANTAATYYDVQFKRAIQPTDDVFLEVRNKATGIWIRLDLAKYFTGTYYTDLKEMNGANGIGFTIVNKTNYKYRVLAGVVATTVSGVGNWTWATVIADATYGYDRWRVRKISNGNMAEVPPTVFASASRTTAYTVTTNVAIPFETIIKDTHGAFTLSTGRFTAPITGTYEISGSYIQGSSGNTLSLYKSGSLLRSVGTGTTSYVSFCAKLYLYQGEYIDLRIDGAISVTKMYLDVARVG
jgi:hypothetical protein